MFISTPQPRRGGRVLHDRFWTPEMEDHRFVEWFGYDEPVVRDAKCQVIRLKLGSIVLFNSRFFHRVARRVAAAAHVRFVLRPA